MAEKKGYGQYCPIAIAAEVMAERWTPLVLRGLFCGATRFNDIQNSVPRMSSALLSRRLKELEYANIIERRPVAGRRVSEYSLTQAGEELFPVLETMGEWALKWLRPEITSEENLDPNMLMWELRRAALNANRKTDKRRVAQFQLNDVPAAKRLYWLVFEPDDVDICVRDPGYDVDIWISSTMRTLIEIWLGQLSLSAALDDERLILDGTRGEIAAFREWFALSHFAKFGDASAAS